MRLVPNIVSDVKVTWKTDLSEKMYPLEDTPIEITIDWKGKLPYPEGEDIRGRIRDIKPKK